MSLIICKNCKRQIEHHSKGMCTTCYKKLVWIPKKKICKRCGREIPIHAKGYCRGCYNFVFHLDKTKAFWRRKVYNIDIETYRRKTEKCIICGFDKVIDLHHLDENKKNSSDDNLIGLCPNHHKMLHDYRYKPEILQQLNEKGFNVSEFKKELKRGFFN